ncbi:MAG: hypothetical protein Q7S88_03430 [Candidatus Daviesbacteria bacterium]|nr:hypothetical protein [Candidatus Daviesbacteria bacterium]
MCEGIKVVAKEIIATSVTTGEDVKFIEPKLRIQLTVFDKRSNENHQEICTDPIRDFQRFGRDRFKAQMIWSIAEIGRLGFPMLAGMNIYKLIAESNLDIISLASSASVFLGCTLGMRPIIYVSSQIAEEAKQKREAIKPFINS